MKKNKSNFEGLHIYRTSEDLADIVWRTVSTWNWFARKTLGQQIVSSADSIGASIAEGIGRGSFMDQRQFICFARGSLYKTKHWVRRARRRQLLTKREQHELHRLIDQLSSMINAYINSITRMATSPTISD